MGITVLSLFDGISCGQVALQRAGIKVDRYLASEIDKYAIKVTQKNFPNTDEHNPMGICEKTGKEIGVSFILSRLKKAPAWCPYRRKRK